LTRCSSNDGNPLVSDTVLILTKKIRLVEVKIYHTILQRPFSIKKSFFGQGRLTEGVRPAYPEYHLVSYYGGGVIQFFTPSKLKFIYDFGVPISSLCEGCTYHNIFGISNQRQEADGKFVS